MEILTGMLVRKVIDSSYLIIIKIYLRISKSIRVAFFASPYLKIAFDLRGEKIITGNKIPDSRTWKSGSKYSALVRGGPEGALAQRP